jgi:hypothetical protein
MATILSKEQNAGGHWQVRVQLPDSSSEFFQFSFDPSQEQVDAVANAHYARLVGQRKLTELEEIERQVLAGQNPFPPGGGGFTYSSRYEALGFLFQRLVGAPAAKILQSAPLIDGVTDAEFGVLGMTAEQIAGIRSKVSELKALKTLLDGYTPPQ